MPVPPSARDAQLRLEIRSFRLFPVFPPDLWRSVIEPSPMRSASATRSSIGRSRTAASTRASRSIRSGSTGRATPIRCNARVERARLQIGLSRSKRFAGRRWHLGKNKSACKRTVRNTLTRVSRKLEASCRTLSQLSLREPAYWLAPKNKTTAPGRSKCTLSRARPWASNSTSALPVCQYSFETRAVVT